MHLFIIPIAHRAVLRVLKLPLCPKRPLNGSTAIVPAVMIIPAIMWQGCVGIIGGRRREIYGSVGADGWRARGRRDECLVSLTPNGLKWIQLVGSLCARNSCLSHHSVRRLIYSCSPLYVLLIQAHEVRPPFTHLCLFPLTDSFFPFSHNLPNVSRAKLVSWAHSC